MDSLQITKEIVEIVHPSDPNPSYFSSRSICPHSPESVELKEEIDCSQELNLLVNSPEENEEQVIAVPVLLHSPTISMDRLSVLEEEAELELAQTVETKTASPVLVILQDQLADDPSKEIEVKLIDHIKEDLNPVKLATPTVEVEEPGLSLEAIGDPMVPYDRRNSSAIFSNLKATLYATGATFRPPFTPSNSLLSPPPTKTKRKKKGSKSRLVLESSVSLEGIHHGVKTVYITTPMQSVVHQQHQSEDDHNRMRSSSVRPPPRTPSTTNTNNFNHINFSSRPSASSSNLRNPSLPSTPKLVNKKYANVKSKVNATSGHTPQQSNVRIFHQPVKFNVSSRVGSLQNATHTPGGGNVRIEHHKINYKENAKPRIEDKATVSATKSDKKIFSQRIQLDSVQSKVGSLENAAHVPGGGNVKVSDYAVSLARTPRSHDNASRTTSSNNSRRSSSTAPPRSAFALGREEARSSESRDFDLN